VNLTEPEAYINRDPSHSSDASKRPGDERPIQS